MIASAFLFRSGEVGAMLRVTVGFELKGLIFGLNLFSSERRGRLEQGRNSHKNNKKPVKSLILKGF
jgi:hypothetical protein